MTATHLDRWNEILADDDVWDSPDHLEAHLQELGAVGAKLAARVDDLERIVTQAVSVLGAAGHLDEHGADLTDEGVALIREAGGSWT
ncbi:MAG: hypothetical protein AAGA90_23900 [Actinomycetota bacterium]